jgi:hypothetical protein
VSTGFVFYLPPRNLLVGECQNLWVLDWDQARYYPDYLD